ncbi:MAG: hypothetical protein ACI83P_001844 [Janthinobacterium sp.]|jgi:hypothetical protein
MLISCFKQHCAALLLAGLLAPALASTDHPSIKRPFDLPPSADLVYSIKASQRGITLSGDAVINWRAGGDAYSIVAETRTPLFGKILDNKSAGAVDGFGLAPAQYYEKRLFKEANTTQFSRATKSISFSEGDKTYPIKGGEQDRASAQWQLIAVARGAPEKFTPGSEWAFFVAGRHDAERWVFKVVKRETLHTSMGDIDTLHLIKAPPPDAKGQQLDIWLAPNLDWYPVRLRFDEGDGDFVEQTLVKISKQ